MLCTTMTDELLVSGSGDSTARVWSLQSLDCLHVLEGHTDTVNEVVVKVGQPYVELYLIESVIS